MTTPTTTPPAFRTSGKNPASKDLIAKVQGLNPGEWLDTGLEEDKTTRARVANWASTAKKKGFGSRVVRVSTDDEHLWVGRPADDSATPVTVDQTDFDDEDEDNE